ncbi:GDSL-type esterase/lipase family protein [Nocardioides sp. CFH 31398]|uniref:SGNH/GDSL hydrolase family protein n=1 Tax=Nocardioides sp. CFH 31398 TaxID=2919579 RepID=UPI001F0541CD|nr:GDSL-type esterase/lipase family protein [Nocardioides sp. CFH 31398]MCH1865423.1 GDSL-type esterase/lipase family protein [Nocardioides sp. CFH 31398]
MSTGTQAVRRRRLPWVLAVGAALVAVLVVVVLVATQGRGAPFDLSPGGGEDTESGSACGLLDPGDRDLRIMFVGDSMTQGRAGSASYRYWVWRGLQEKRDDVAFVGPTIALNGSDSPEGYEHLDHGFDDNLFHAAQARSTFETLEAQYPVDDLVATYEPDVVVLQLGFNDANALKATPEVIAERTADYMRQVWAADDALGRERTRFVLGQIPTAEQPSKQVTTEAKNERTDGANELIERQWGSRPCLVQVNRLRTGSNLDWVPGEYTYDGSHPDAAGETLMADRMLAAMGRLGLFEGKVRVYDPDERWDPAPRITAGVLRDGRVRVTWDGERERSSADAIRLQIRTDGERRKSAWTDTPSTTLALGPGTHELSAQVRRGLPGRMVSEPGPAVTVEVPADAG